MFGSAVQPDRACRPAAPPLPCNSPTALADAIAALVEACLVGEVELTPKPGLVDRANSGAHRDMDHTLFLRSAAAIRPWFARLFVTGAETADLPARAILPLLRPDGLACERAMFAATDGVNTHKGSIFAFGLITAALGRTWARHGRLDRDLALDEVADISRGIVARELAPRCQPKTAGERLYQLYGLTGARGEAETGFSTVRRSALPMFETAMDSGLDEETALHAAFLHLLEHNADTNLVARGGLAGLAFARTEAARLNARGGIRAPGWRADIAELDKAFIAKNLSPGGSADLLALTLFLHRLHAFCAREGVAPEQQSPDFRKSDVETDACGIRPESADRDGCAPLRPARLPHRNNEHNVIKRIQPKPKLE